MTWSLFEPRGGLDFKWARSLMTVQAAEALS